MPHSFGSRARTRHMFKRNFREHGAANISTFLRVFKVGDIVDIVANSSEQKGMPHKFYHGKTGIVFNVAPRAVGVIAYKVVNGRYIEKRVNVRIEHVRHSKCRQEFLDRVKSNAAKKREAKEKGETVVLKRLPAQPREARVISIQNNVPQTLTALPYETTI
ncbi:60S ribosomal protein L21A [Apiotrichum porosum]|uniref:60S ribosomal protein L21A n=1 Tax=Apiotrichum porosum TaxID=105984 RepID=A0A427Y8S0_9TREE|nr:60S ribosomal protein L21A [Apiotrichum porosum]RSH87498.1 60S ribosomal protein L21A [Apiotrichum porosum]